MNTWEDMYVAFYQYGNPNFNVWTEQAQFKDWELHHPENKYAHNVEYRDIIKNQKLGHVG